MPIAIPFVTRVTRVTPVTGGFGGRLASLMQGTMENRHGLAVAGMVTLATGTAERRASETMLKAKVNKLGRRITVGEDSL